MPKSSWHALHKSLWELASEGRSCAIHRGQRGALDFLRAVSLVRTERDGVSVRRAVLARINFRKSCNLQLCEQLVDSRDLQEDASPIGHSNIHDTRCANRSCRKRPTSSACGATGQNRLLHSCPGPRSSQTQTGTSSRVESQDVDTNKIWTSHRRGFASDSAARVEHASLPNPSDRQPARRPPAQHRWLFRKWYVPRDIMNHICGEHGEYKSRLHYVLSSFLVSPKSTLPGHLIEHRPRAFVRVQKDAECPEISTLVVTVAGTGVGSDDHAILLAMEAAVVDLFRSLGSTPGRDGFPPVLRVTRPAHGDDPSVSEICVSPELISALWDDKRLLEWLAQQVARETGLSSGLEVQEGNATGFLLIR